MTTYLPPVAESNPTQGASETETVPAVTGDGGVRALVDWASEFGRVVEGRAVDIDVHGAIPVDVVAQLKASGLFRLWLPVELGGLEADPGDVVQIISTLSRAEASTGWLAAIGIATNTIAAYLPRATAFHMFPTGREFAAGNPQPLGTLTRGTQETFELSGTWPFGSGVEHADWVVCGVRQAGSAPGGGLSVVPRSAITRIDPWLGLGLRGSGSGHFHIRSASVSSECCLLSAANRPWAAGSLWRLPMSTFLYASIAAVAIGIGRRAVAQLVVAAQAASGGGPVPDEIRFDQIARILALIDSSYAYLVDSLRRLVSADPDSADIRRLKAVARLAIINAGQSAESAVEQCYRGAGSQALDVESEAQRALRDIGTAIQHVAISVKSYPRVGRDIAALFASAAP